MPKYETFPRAYLQGSEIAKESRVTLGILSDIRTFGHIRSEFSQIDSKGTLVTPAPGFVWDCPELNEVLDGLSELGLLYEQERNDSGDEFVPIHVVDDVRPILRGYVEHVRTVALRHDPGLVLYLKVRGFPDAVLHGERHDVVGWHYHYCDRHGRRSDTLLSFDTGQPFKRDDKGNPVPLRVNSPLFWERHGVNKAKLKARAELWGDEKRESIFEAAQPDLDRFKPVDFRRPADDATAVWPQSAILSPRSLRSR
ncbi:hypothetical protein [Bradyrhizobium sp. Bra78]|uniref:hypothetical protein n=1 Tax=Bradyrhizobium sp. Bra78 TaxID=2926010 RepID=UPI0021C95563|nr:hypothetical protein [Bradyrhizobium sp. Bra78]